MTDLVRYYLEYYREQTPSAFDDLFRCMLDYDFSSYHDDMRRVFAMHQQAKCLGAVASLRSGGSSTGRRRKYEFGPNFDRIRFLVEGFLRLSENKTVSLVGATGLKSVKFEDGNPPQNDFQLWGEWHNDNFLFEMFEFVESKQKEFGPINILSKPHVWIQLTTNPIFQEWSSSSSFVKSFVNSDNTKCFFRPRRRVIDQMIDWFGGANFYTCTEGKYHFLPCFYVPNSHSSVNLLNLKRHPSVPSDFVSMNNRAEMCACGKPMIAMRFAAHHANFPKDSFGRFIDPDLLADMASERTRFFQVYQSSDGFFTVFHDAPNAEMCLMKISKWLDSLGFGKTRIVTSKYIMVGTKVPFLWRGGNPTFAERK